MRPDAQVGGARVAQTPLLGLRLVALINQPPPCTLTSMSRLRHPFLSNHFVFLVANRRID